MLQSAIGSGAAHRRSVFELFPRRLPPGRRYGVVAGVGRALDAIESFRFTDTEIDFLRSEKIVDEATLEFLASYRFTGDIWGYPEGETYFPYSPLLVVESTFAEAVLLETVILSIYNHDAAIASAASRMTWAAGDRPCIEMGSRRTHEGRRWRAPGRRTSRGSRRAPTSARARSTAYRPPARPPTRSRCCTTPRRTRSARRCESLGKGTTLLVDTYDIAEAVRLGVEIAGPELGAVRIDSGDLGLLAHRVREQLDELGCPDTRIVVTSDLDEFAIAGLASAPVNGYGVGTQLVVGSGHPTCGFVYKLVAREDETGKIVGVAKKSKDKISIGGRKYALRRLSSDGVAEAEVIGIGKPAVDDGDDRALLVPLVAGGEIVGRESLEASRERHLRSRNELPLVARQLSKGDPVIETVFEGYRRAAG